MSVVVPDPKVFSCIPVSAVYDAVVNPNSIKKLSANG